jgi:hypothetical protein
MRLPLPLLLALAAAPAAAQARYLPQADTLYYESLNPYRMYAVRGGDTLGGPVRSYSINRQVWRAEGGGLVVETRTELLSAHPTRRESVLEVTPRGAVRTEDGEADRAFGQYDAFVRLPPDGDLREGRIWHDTLSSVVPVPGGEYAFQAWRELRVERIVDTLGARMAVIRGTGRMRYRHTDPVDSAGARPWWMDTSGPLRETFLFDLEHGRMAAREWWMDLRGIGGFPRADGGVDTLAAGLLSADTLRLVSAERARVMARPMEGDTMVTTAAQGDILLHVVRRGGACVRSGFGLNDGTRLTAEACHPGGRTERYALVHTRPTAEPMRRTVVLADGMLRVSGDRDTTLAVPPGRWAMSEHGMDEHLAPLLAAMALAGETQAEISVLRPFTLAWDRVRVELAPVEDAIMGTLRWEPEGETLTAAVFVLVSKGGDLLYAEGVQPHVYLRRPPPGTVAAKRVDALVQAAIRLLGEH